MRSTYVPSYPEGAKRDGVDQYTRNLRQTSSERNKVHGGDQVGRGERLYDRSRKSEDVDRRVVGEHDGMVGVQLAKLSRTVLYYHT